jgi:hypothetical protein
MSSLSDGEAHDLLDDLPQAQALRCAREMLVSSCVLPARNEHLELRRPGWISAVRTCAVLLRWI